MRKNKKQRRIMLLLILILSITIGFALLSTTLKINGSASIKSNTWNIHWDDRSINVTQGSVSATDPIVSTTTSTKDTVSFDVELELPGDYFEFNVDAVNEGSVDGALDLAENWITYKSNGTATTLPSYMDFKVVYDDDTTPATGDVLKASESQTYKIRVEFKSSVEELPENPEPLTIEVNLPYVQHKDTSCSLNMTTGSIVYFDPVNYEFCEEEKNTCYRWMTINKESNKYDLLMLSKSNDFKWNISDLVSIISNGTSTWNNKLVVDSKYNVHITDAYSIEFSQTKARLMLRSEFDNLSNDNKESLKLFCGMNENSQNCGLLDIENNLTNFYTPGGIFNRFQISEIPNGANMGDTIDARPVINIDVSDIEGACSDKCLSFAYDSMENVSNNISSYPVGCQRVVSLNPMGVRRVRLANNTTPSECSQEGFSQTSCGTVLEFIDLLSVYEMDDSGSNNGGWENSDMREYVNYNMYNMIENSVKNRIIDTEVVSGHGREDSNNFTTTDKLYLLEPKEVFGSNPGHASASNKTRQLDYYNSKNVTLDNNKDEVLKKYNGSISSWWLRSANDSLNSDYYWVSNYGNCEEEGITSSNKYVAPAFRIR